MADVPRHPSTFTTVELLGMCRVERLALEQRHGGAAPRAQEQHLMVPPGAARFVPELAAEHLAAAKAAGKVDDGVRLRTFESGSRQRAAGAAVQALPGAASSAAANNQVRTR